MNKNEMSNRPHHLSEARDENRAYRSSDMFGWENRGFDEGRYSARMHGSEQSDYSGYRPDNIGKNFGKGPKGWKRSDETIREEVCEALFRDSEIDASDIEVTVESNCVYLKGNVDDRETKRAAERCVEHITGVEDVQNDLKIGKQAPPMRSSLDKSNH